MKFQVYILYSEKINSFYKGQTSNLTDRLYRHNHRYEKATQAGVPWKLIWTSEKPTRSEALILEKKLKNLSVKRTIEIILKYKEGIPRSDELLFLQKLSDLSVSLLKEPSQKRQGFVFFNDVLHLYTLFPKTQFILQR